jgi:hypothetical protein
MKQTPELTAAQSQMAPGLISRDGFLGDDPRLLADILAEDAARVAALGLTHAQIAERMQVFTDAARRMLGAPAEVEDRYEVAIQEVRGVVPCPWPHPGTFPKSMVRLTRKDTGETISWTELQIHMVAEHGFYEGRGSPFRIAPADLARILDL